MSRGMFLFENTGPDECQLGTLGHTRKAFTCERPAVVEIAGVRLCAHHQRLLESIRIEEANRMAGVAA